jgi:hypothetical protein
MFLVIKADIVAIREVYDRDGEFAAAVELRRLFPGIPDNAMARENVRAIVGWKPLPKAAAPTRVRHPRRPRVFQTTGGAAMSERKEDRTSEESFPASDPPGPVSPDPNLLTSQHMMPRMMIGQNVGRQRSKASRLSNQLRQIMPRRLTLNASVWRQQTTVPQFSNYGAS